MHCHLEHLGVDELQIISTFLNKPELLSLAIVSRHYNHIATPLIYRRISLLLRISQPPIQRTPQSDNNDALQVSQRMLLETLTTCPELARHTRTLEWQIQPVSSAESTPSWRWSMLTAQHTLELDGLYHNLLPMFCNVTKVHLVPSTHYTPASLPKAVFPSVTSVKLTHRITPELVKSILHAPAQISELSLDTIDFYVEIVQWLAETPFPTLRRLSLRHGPVVTRARDSEFEMVLFSAWKTVLLSTHTTLREILLGFKHSIPGCNIFHLSPDVVPYPEGRLAKIVAPVFSQVTWPGLRVVELEGVLPFPGLWEPLAASVPRLIMDHEEKWTIERWDPVTAAKF